MLTSALFNPAADEGTLGTPAAHVAAPRAINGDWLEHLHVAADLTHVYAFWNITQLSSGFAQTWFSSAPLAALSSWSAPAPLAVAIGEETFQAAWASPAQTDFIPTSLPLAVQLGEELGIIYFANGEVSRYESVVALQAPGLIGLPMLYAALDGRLTLTWAQPTPIGAALNITRQPG